MMVKQHKRFHYGVKILMAKAKQIRIKFKGVVAIEGFNDGGAV